MSKKIIASVLAVTFAFSMVGSAGAVTLEELQDLYDDLLAKYELLLAQLGQPTTTTGLCLSSDLSQGTTSAEVQTLQKGLNQNAATQLAAAGAGAPGYETTYFGPLTKAAVIKFQELYSSEVLASWGLTKGTGFVGSTTRAKFNALYCTPVTTPTTLPGETTTTTVALSGGEGTLTASTAPIYTESTLKWGVANQTIYGFKVKAMNSDIAIKRVFVKLANPAGSLIPWKDLSYIALYDGDNAVKGLEVTKANLVENTYGKEYDVYFDGINVVVPKGQEKTFSIKVSTLSNPELKTGFTISLPAQGIRGVDGAGINQYNSALVTGKDVIYEGSKTTASIQIRNDSTTPQTGIILGSKDSVTKDKEIFKFGIKASNNDAILKEAVINLKLSTDTTFITAAYLFDGDNRLSSQIVEAATTSQEIAFTDLDVSLNKDVVKYLAVKVDVAKLTDSLQGQSIDQVGINSTATGKFIAIDADDNPVTAKSGSATGYKQTVYSAAPIFALTSAKLTLDESTTSSGVAEFKFTVTGQGDTVYIKDDITWFVATSSNKDAMTLGTGVVNGSKAPISSYYEIYPEEPITFTVQYPANAASSTSNLVYAALTNVQWNTSASTSSAKNGSDIFDFSTWKTNAVNMKQ